MNDAATPDLLMPAVDERAAGSRHAKPRSAATCFDDPVRHDPLRPQRRHVARLC